MIAMVETRNQSSSSLENCGGKSGYIGHGLGASMKNDHQVGRSVNTALTEKMNWNSSDVEDGCVHYLISVASRGRLLQ